MPYTLTSSLLMYQPTNLVFALTLRVVGSVSDTRSSGDETVITLSNLSVETIVVYGALPFERVY